jgi:hypothetical protein
MAAANAELEKLAQEGGLEGKRLEDVGEGDEYVEMELGLGVMEEKSDDSSDESSDDSSEDSEDDDEEDKEQKQKQKEKEQKEKDILGRLMGHKQGREKAAGIQEVE